MDLIDKPEFSEGPFFIPDDSPTQEIHPLVDCHHGKWFLERAPERFNAHGDYLPVTREERDGYH